MTLDEKHPTPRPGDPFTAQDGARLFNQISQEIRSLRESISGVSGTLANILNKEIVTLELLARIEAGLSGSRITRLEQEVREAELELERAEAARKAAEEKVKLKSEVKDNNIDTQERLNRLADNAYDKLEREKRAAQDAKIQDLKWSVIKAVVTWGSVGIVAIIASVIWYFVRQYIIQGSP